MKTSARSLDDIQILDFLSGFLVVLFAFFLIIHFAFPSITPVYGDSAYLIFSQSRQ